MYEKEDKKYKIYQGDIFQNVDYLRWVDTINKVIDVIEIPYFLVLTQSCDLEQDYKDRQKTEKENRDKYLQSILVCPAYRAEVFKRGEHLKNFDLIMCTSGGTLWKIIKKNNNARYHFMERNEEFGLPDLVIDFKHYYTIPTHILYEIYKDHYVNSLKSLFRENISHRFAFYLSIIGLPMIENKGGKN